MIATLGLFSRVPPQDWEHLYKYLTTTENSSIRPRRAWLPRVVHRRMHHCQLHVNLLQISNTELSVPMRCDSSLLDLTFPPFRDSVVVSSSGILNPAARPSFRTQPAAKILLFKVMMNQRPTAFKHTVKFQCLDGRV